MPRLHHRRQIAWTDLHDATSIQTAHRQTVEGRGYQATPAPNYEGVHGNGVSCCIAGCSGGLCPTTQEPPSSPTQQQAALQ